MKCSWNKVALLGNTDAAVFHTIHMWLEAKKLRRAQDYHFYGVRTSRGSFTSFNGNVARDPIRNVPAGSNQHPNRQKRGH